MKTITLTDREAKALLFELNSALETVETGIKEGGDFIGEDEILLGIIAKLN